MSTSGLIANICKPSRGEGMSVALELVNVDERKRKRNLEGTPAVEEVAANSWPVRLPRSNPSPPKTSPIIHQQHPLIRSHRPSPSSETGTIKGCMESMVAKPGFCGFRVGAPQHVIRPNKSQLHLVHHVSAMLVKMRDTLAFMTSDTWMRRDWRIVDFETLQVKPFRCLKESITVIDTYTS